MPAKISPEWQDRLRNKLATFDPLSSEQPDHIDEHISYNKAAQWLITRLGKRNIAFRVYNLGAGVKRIVTVERLRCPCCKRKFQIKQKKEIMTVEKLIKKYERARADIINPNYFISWKEIGFSKKPDEWDSIEDFLKEEGEFDEGEQTSLSLIAEFLDDLKKSKEE